MHESAKSKGVTGVPMTIIDGKWAVCGTQSSDVYIQASPPNPHYSSVSVDVLAFLDFSEACSWSLLYAGSFLLWSCRNRYLGLRLILFLYSRLSSFSMQFSVLFPFFISLWFIVLTKLRVVLFYLLSLGDSLQLVNLYLLVLHGIIPMPTWLSTSNL